MPNPIPDRPSNWSQAIAGRRRYEIRCPGCGEMNIIGASAMIELLPDGQWLCRTCCRIFIDDDEVTS